MSFLGLLAFATPAFAFVSTIPSTAQTPFNISDEQYYIELDPLEFNSWYSVYEPPLTWENDAGSYEVSIVKGDPGVAVGSMWPYECPPYVVENYKIGHWASCGYGDLFLEPGDYRLVAFYGDAEKEDVVYIFTITEGAQTENCATGTATGALCKIGGAVVNSTTGLATNTVENYLPYILIISILTILVYKFPDILRIPFKKK